jgi:hypothetical protein
METRISSKIAWSKIESHFRSSQGLLQCLKFLKDSIEGAGETVSLASVQKLVDKFWQEDLVMLMECYGNFLVTLIELYCLPASPLDPSLTLFVYPDLPATLLESTSCPQVLDLM